MNRKMLAIFLATILVGISFALYFEYRALSNQPSRINSPIPSTSELVKRNAGIVAAAAMSQANLLNLSFNFSSTVNKIMGQYFALENTTAFQSYSKNYSSSIIVSCTYSINTLPFNSSDPFGLDSDYVYIEFLDIYTYYHNNTGQPTQLGSITYSINAGTGNITGPALSIQNEVYA